RRCFGVICFQFEPDIRLAQIRDQIDPKPVRPELENATVRFFFNQRQGQSIAIKSDGLFVSVSRTFDRDVGAAGKLRTVNVRYHDAEMLNPPASDTTNELPCSSAERRPIVKSTRGRRGRARLRRAAEPFEALLIGFIRVISG